MKWTEENIPNLDGKVIIVTGGNSGLGLACVDTFAVKGASVVMACRDVSKGKLALSTIGESKGSVDVMKLDLQEPESIRSFAQGFKSKYDRLDILVNNAGIMMAPYSISLLGVESQFATNHLGHFMLTGLLLDCIKSTPQSRVVSVSSLAHRNGVLNLEDINYHEGKDYKPMLAYRRSKLANLVFAYELDRFFKAKKIDAVSVVAHPGVSPTNIMNHKLNAFVRFLISPLANLCLQDVGVGALASIRAAVDGDAQGGAFYGPSGRGEMRGYPVLVKSTEASHDATLGQRLWHYSERITGIVFES